MMRSNSYLLPVTTSTHKKPGPTIIPAPPAVGRGHLKVEPTTTPTPIMNTITKPNEVTEEDDIYDGMEVMDHDQVDDVGGGGLSSISTSMGADDLYDDAVMGLVEDARGNNSQETISSNDDVFDDQEQSSGGKQIKIVNLKVGGTSSQRGGGGGLIKNSLGEGIDTDEGIGSPSHDGGGGRKNTAGGTRFALYVGNLTWWTSHEDIKEALKLVGVLDVLDVKIYECRANGQSKGYALVVFSSEESIKLVVEQLDKTEIHGRVPVVKPDGKASSAYFDSLSKTRPPIPTTSTSSSGSSGYSNGSDHSGYGSRTNGQIMTPYNGNGGVGPPGNGGGGRYGGMQGIRSGQFNRGHFGARGGSASMGLMGPRPPPPWGPFGNSMGNSHNRYPPRMANSHFHLPPRGPPPGYGLPQHPPPGFDDWRSPPPSYIPRVHLNPAFLNRFQMYQNDMDYASSAMDMDENDGYNSGQGHSYNKPQPIPQYGGTVAVEDCLTPERLPRANGVVERPGSALPLSPIEMKNVQPISSSSTYATSSSTPVKDELDMDEQLERSNSICSQAIQRAVKDASNGDYAGAIETLVTAISLIKGSKVAKDKRCQVLICSLQESLEGIEHRSYGRQKAERLARSSSSRRLSPQYVSKSRDYGRSHPHHQERDDRSYVARLSRRRAWDERDQVERLERDPRCKTSRLDDGREEVYRRWV